MRWIAAAIAGLAVAVLIAGFLVSKGIHEQACAAHVEAQFPSAFSESGTGIYQSQPGFVFHGPHGLREAELTHCGEWP